jgi:hypothetical protein
MCDVCPILSVHICEWSSLCPSQQYKTDLYKLSTVLLDRFCMVPTLIKTALSISITVHDRMLIYEFNYSCLLLKLIEMDVNMELVNYKRKKKKYK